jgi:hypothetical protein
VASRVRTALILAAFAAASPSAAQDISRIVPPSGVIGVQDAMLSPDYWVARTASPNTLLMTPGEIEVRNRRSFATDPNLVDLARIGPTIPRERVLGWLKSIASPLTSPPVDAKGKPIDRETLVGIVANEDADTIPASQPARYGMAVRRAQLRIYPTELHAFASTDSLDFESFQAGILFPGDAVVVLHRSRDRRWLLVQTWQGPAWVRDEDIATGPAAEILGYRDAGPVRIVTGSKVRTVFTPEAPAVSELQLDMGASVPLAQVPPDQPVNGEGPSQSWPIKLPTRADDGTLRFIPALLPKTEGSAAGYLPLTRADIIRQTFKFLGERYGWGHMYNARDCSGFTSDVYRSMGVILPPNSGEQGSSPAIRHQLFTAADSKAARLKAVMAADVGDLLVVPGHVMMFLGKIGGQPYVIQDVPYAIFHDAAGKLHKTKLNQVSVTPLLPLLYDDNHSYVDAMTSLVHVTAR